MDDDIDDGPTVEQAEVGPVSVDGSRDGRPGRGNEGGSATGGSAHSGGSLGRPTVRGKIGGI